jgi:quercetin dioxygenase-like cupin family protein
MPMARVIRDGDFDWRDPSPPDGPKTDDPKAAIKILLDQQGGLPSLQRVRFEPNFFSPPHSHEEDEVIYLLSGTISMGDQLLPKGDALFIPKHTRYSLRAGNEGAEFVRVGFPLSD